MPRAKKQVLKKRRDGRFACRYKDQWFYSSISSEDALRQRDDFKQEEKRGLVSSYFVRDFSLKWVDRTYPEANIKTRKGVERHVQILNDEIGNLPVCDVKPSDIKQVFSTRYVGLSDSYIKAGRQVFSAVFDSAVADGLIPANPARDKTAKPHKGKKGGHRAITPQERHWIETLCLDHRAHPVAMAMLYAGLRPQEAKALDIDRDVDFKAETITVRQTAHTDPQNWQNYAFTDVGKTERANRRIPLLPPLKRALNGKHGYLITSAHGKPVTRTTWSCVWQSYCRQMEKQINGIDRNWYGRTREHKAIIAAGGTLPPWIPFDVTPYDLRHSFATFCRDQTPPIELHTVIKWMGHSDASMILKIYDEVQDSRDEQEAERLKKLTTVLTTKP